MDKDLVITQLLLIYVHGPVKGYPALLQREDIANKIDEADQLTEGSGNVATEYVK